MAMMSSSTASVAFQASSAALLLSHASSSSSQLSIRSTAPPAGPFLASPLRFTTSIISRRFPVVAMASPGGSVTNLDKLYEQVEESIAEAQEVCVADDTSGECRVAWDKVEELSAEVAHRRTRAKSKGDSLLEFCKETPEADECRVYED